MGVQNKKIYYSLPLYFVLAIYVFAVIISHSFQFPYKLLAVAIFLSTVPNLLVNRLGIIKTVVVEFVFLALTAVVFGNKGIFPLSLFALAGIFITIKAIKENLQEELRGIPDILGVILLAFFLIHFFWFFSFFDLDYKMRILNGLGQNDTFYHMAISNMIMVGHLPSTGLNLTPYHPYHWLSHIIFALVGKITSVEIYRVYTYAVPFFLFPVFLQFLQSLISKYSKDNGHFLLLPLILFGLFPATFTNPHEGVYLVSESQFLGIIFIFAFLYANSHGSRNKYNPFFVFFGFLAKICMGILFWITDSLYIIFSEEAWKNKIIKLSFTALAAFLGSLLTVFIGAGDQSDRLLIFRPFYQLKQSFPDLSIPFGLWVLFYPFFLAAAAFLLSKKKEFIRKDNLFYLLLILVSFFIGLTSTSLLTGGWVWFVNLLYWAPIPILLIFIVNILKGRSVYPPIKYPLILIIIFLSGSNLYGRYKIYLSQYKNYFNNKPALNQKGERFLPYFQALENIKIFDPKNNYVVEIPLSEADYWERSNYTAFHIPVVSYHVALNANLGSVLGEYQEFPHHSYSQYWNKESSNLCKDTKYKGVIRIWKNDLGQVVFRPFDCNAQGSVEQLIPESAFEEFFVNPAPNNKEIVYNIGSLKQAGFLLKGSVDNLPPVQFNYPPKSLKYKLMIFKENYGLRKTFPMEKVSALMAYGLKRIAEKEKWKDEQQNIPDYIDKFELAIKIFKNQVDFDRHFITVGSYEEHYFQALNSALTRFNQAEALISDPEKREKIKEIKDGFILWATQSFSHWCPFQKFCYADSADEQKNIYFVGDEDVKRVYYGANYGSKPVLDPTLWGEMKFGVSFNIKNCGELVFEKGADLRARLIQTNASCIPALLIRKEDDKYFFIVVAN